MKILTFVLIASFLLVACGPSKEEVKLTKQMTELEQQLITYKAETDIQGLEIKGKELKLVTLRNYLKDAEKTISRQQQSLQKSEAAINDYQSKIEQLSADYEGSVQRLNRVKVQQVKRQKQSDETTSDLKKQLTQKESNISQLNSALSSSQLENKSHQRQINQLRQNSQTQEKLNKENVSKINNQLHLTLLKVNEAQVEVAHLKEQMRLQQQNSKNEINQAKEDLSALNLSLESVQQEKKELEKSLSEQQQSNEKLLAQLASIQAEEEKLSNTLKKTTTNLTKARSKASRLNNSYDRMLREHTQLLSSDSKKAKAINSMRVELEQAQQDVARLSGARGIYTIQQGDILSTIAHFFYHDATRWPDIFKANSFILDDPDLIYRGMVLIIPQ
ncbi:MAG: LysM peptidoglycan-binding domain-containing protein [Gammaproteobacteria bacterium]|nr:LysM peptidoglycan-binding domain-containing protein [Gammaproteobacteria bacterium]